MRDDDKNILDKSNHALNKSTEQLDAQTLSRLNQARQKALSQKTYFFPLNIPLVPAGFFAALSIAVVTGSLYLSAPDDTLSFDEAEFIASNEDVELMEDLEFVAWLIEQENAS